MADNAAQLSDEVTIFTNGSKVVEDQVRSMTEKSPFKVEPREIVRLTDTSDGVDVEFKNGGSKSVAFLVHNSLTVPQGPFVQQLGLKMSPTGDINAEAPIYQASCRGVFAAGYCISPFKVVPQAIASGNFAGVAAATQLQAEKYGHISMI
jgi:thioredoxin reductase